MHARAESCDVVVLGAGPAGSATAIALRRRDPGLRVVVLDRRDHTGPRVGETITPACQPLFSALGVWDDVQGQGWLESFGTSAAWGSGELHENEFLFGPYGNGWHVERSEFDALLSRAAQDAGADVRTRIPRVSVHRNAAGWVARMPGYGELRARFLVDATGRAAAFASKNGAARTRHDDLVGVFVFFDLTRSARPLRRYALVEASEHGWWYVAPLPASRAVAACFTDAHLVRPLGLRSLESWLARLRDAPHASRALRGARPLGTPTVHPAWTQSLDRAGGARWLAVGDSASTFDPLSSQGIFKALRAGLCAAPAIAESLEGGSGTQRAFEQLAAAEVAEHLEVKRAYYAEERRWPSSVFWNRRRATPSPA